MSKFLFTSESVTEGHPDKLCDRISDSVLDALLVKDPNARCACESFCTTGAVMLMGEISTTAEVDYEQIARDAIIDIGYDNDELGFNGHNCPVQLFIHEQSSDIALGVDNSMEYKNDAADELDLHGAGDQGIMFGYACNETKELMPITASLSHELCKQLTKVRKNGTLKWLRPDGKSQVTVLYEDGKPVHIDTVVVSTQHDDCVTIEEIRKEVTEKVIVPVMPKGLFDENTRILINPTGRFVIGGPVADTGLTGRKIIVDTYGGCARHGGGAFSGKDPTKVDRCAAYASRYAAKNIVAAGLAEKCEIQLGYAIGVANPVSICVNTFGTAKVCEDKLSEAVSKVFDFRPAAIIRDLNLRTPIYSKVAAYGHMGREDLNLPWEKTDKVDALLEAVK